MVLAILLVLRHTSVTMALVSYVNRNVSHVLIALLISVLPAPLQ